MGKFLLLVSGSLLLNMAAGFNTPGFGKKSVLAESTQQASLDSSGQIPEFYRFRMSTEYVVKKQNKR